MSIQPAQETRETPNLDGSLRIPASAQTFEGFRQWVRATLHQRVGRARTDYRGGEIFVEFPWLDRGVTIPPNTFTLEGFRRWMRSTGFPNRGKVSFLSGEIFIDISPEEIESHNKPKTCILGDLRQFVLSQDLGEVFSDGVDVTNDAADLSNEPDVTFCTWETLETGRAVYREWVEDSERYIELAGTPDLVVEVVSNSFASDDTGPLATQYFKAGIPEYWIIDARRNHLLFRVLTRGESAYVDVPANAEGFAHSSVLSARVRLVRDRNRIGRWRYRLELQT